MTARSQMEKKKNGQASVELIMVLPVLMLVTAAVCQLALSLNYYLIVSAASREGARIGARSNDPVLAKRAASDAAAGLPGERPRIEVEFPEGRSRGSPIRVTVTYRVTALIPGVSRLLPRPTFTKSTSMALERGAD